MSMKTILRRLMLPFRVRKDERVLYEYENGSVSIEGGVLVVKVMFPESIGGNYDLVSAWRRECTDYLLRSAVIALVDELEGKK